MLIIWGSARQPTARTVSPFGRDASLFTAETDSYRMVLNKESATDTASMVFQQGYSGRAEMGLAGDERFRLKVSGDGSTFNTALEADPSTGAVILPATLIRENLLLNSDFSHNARSFSGGALASGAYGFERWKAAPGGANMSRSGTTVTLNSGTIEQVIDTLDMGPLGTDTITIAVHDLTGGALTARIGTASGIINPGAGIQFTTLTIADPAATQITLELSGTGASFTTVHAVRGAFASPVILRTSEVEKNAT